MAFGKRKQRGTTGRGNSGTTGRTVHPGTGISAHSIPSPPELTLQPGQSVLPGSIDTPKGTFGVTEGRTPESVWWSSMEGSNMYDYILALLKNSNKGGSLSQGYADVLGQILKDYQAGDQAINPDWMISLFQNLLSYQTTQEQREYDYRMLNESRQYNNPQNELARYMGAGISRDAALQMMSGSAGNIGSGSGASAAIQSPVAGAGAAALNSSNAHNNLINQVYNGIQLVANLFGQGVDMYSAIQSAQMLQAQNYMTQQQVGAYQQVNQVTQALQNAVTQGILEPTDLEGWSNANDVYKWLIDHADTNLVKPLNESGAISGVFGTTLGRDMFNKHWAQMRDSKDAGKLFDNYVRQQELATSLSQMDLNQSYIDLYSGFMDLQMKNPQLYSAYVQALRQAQAYETEGYYQDVAEVNAYQASIDKRILQRVYEDRSKGGIGTGDDSGINLLSFDEWYGLKQACLRKEAMYDEGDEYWTKYFRSHYRTAVTMQFLKENQADFLKISMDPQGPNPGYATILNTIKILTDAGAWPAIETVTKPFRASNVSFGDNYFVKTE